MIYILIIIIIIVIDTITINTRHLRMEYLIATVLNDGLLILIIVIITILIIMKMIYIQIILIIVVIDIITTNTRHLRKEYLIDNILPSKDNFSNPTQLLHRRRTYPQSN